MAIYFNLRVMLTAVACSLLMACSGPNTSYRKSGSIPVIKVPEDLTSESLEPLYPIPEVAINDLDVDEDFEVPRPEPFGRELSDTGVRIQRLGDRRWILVTAPTSQVWPRAQNFFSRRGISINRSVVSLGLLETDWLKFSADDSIKSKFRLWIEQGVKPDTTEIHVVQKSGESLPRGGATSEETEWPEQSQDSQREAWLLDELAASLVDSVGNNSASLMGQNVGGDVKAQIVSVEQEPVLRLTLDYERAWATLTYALDKEGFVLWQEDSAAGVAYVGYAEPEEKKSFFKRMLGAGKGKRLPEEAPQPLSQLLNHLATEAKVRSLFEPIPGAAFVGESLSDDVGFLVVVTSKESVLHVHVRDSRGRPLATKVAKQMLWTMRSNLI